MQKISFKTHLMNLLMISLGSAVLCTGVNLFYAANELLSGGAYAFAMMGNYLFDIPIGLGLFVINVPLLVWAWYKLNHRLVFYTIWAIIFQSSFLTLTSPYMPGYTDDTLLACIFGGVLIGVGGAWVIRNHGSGGGLDIVGLIIKKRIDISMSTITLFFNVFIIGLAALLFPVEKAMYTMVSMFISAMVFNKVVGGFNPKSSVTIITARGHEMSSQINEVLGRGVTIMKGEGAYTHAEKDILLCIVSRFEVPQLKETVKSVDPEAFVAISTADEVMGRFINTSVIDAALGKKKKPDKERSS
ncbi:MAG: YitT family protein [Clostridiales bacterium]|nr:YitT family protein [Clostridiales bacterium]